MKNILSIILIVLLTTGCIFLPTKEGVQNKIENVADEPVMHVEFQRAAVDEAFRTKLISREQGSHHSIGVTTTQSRVSSPVSDQAQPSSAGFGDRDQKGRRTLLRPQQNRCPDDSGDGREAVRDCGSGVEPVYPGVQAGAFHLG